MYKRMLTEFFKQSDLVSGKVGKFGEMELPSMFQKVRRSGINKLRRHFEGIYIYIYLPFATVADRRSVSSCCSHLSCRTRCSGVLAAGRVTKAPAFRYVDPKTMGTAQSVLARATWQITHTKYRPGRPRLRALDGFPRLMMGACSGSGAPQSRRLADPWSIA